MKTRPNKLANNTDELSRKQELIESLAALALGQGRMVVIDIGVGVKNRPAGASVQMGIVGKIVGGTIGFALGGPLGAIAGAVFGHVFDSDESAPGKSRGNDLSSIEASQLAFFVSTFSMLAKLAQADGPVNNEEINTIEGFARRDLNLSPEERQVAFNIFRTALASPARFDDFAAQFFQRFHNSPQMLEMIVDILLRVSMADGVFSRVEEALILSAVRIFKIDDGRFSRLKARHIASDEQAYEVLGVRRDAGDAEIKQRYRALVQSYHPDKLVSKSLPDEFIQLAHEKFREIQNAYEQIKKERELR